MSVAVGQVYQATPTRSVTVTDVLGDQSKPDGAVVSYHNTRNPGRIEKTSLTNFQKWIVRVSAKAEAQPASVAQNPTGGAQPSA